MMAAEALGKIGDPRAVELLCAALKDAGEHVRSDAPVALGKIGDARAVEPLCAALKDKDLRKSAADALVRIGPPAVGPLCGALNDPDTRWWAAYALGTIGWQPGNDQKGAWYWMAKGDWDKCAALGAAAGPLCQAPASP